MPIRRLAALALLVALSLVTAAAAVPPKDAMVVGLLAEPVTMDPPQITDLNSARITKRIFEGLVGQFLTRRSITVRRYPRVACPECGPCRRSCGPASAPTSGRKPDTSRRSTT